MGTPTGGKLADEGAEVRVRVFVIRLAGCGMPHTSIMYLIYYVGQGLCPCPVFTK